MDSKKATSKDDEAGNEAESAAGADARAQENAARAEESVNFNSSALSGPSSDGRIFLGPDIEIFPSRLRPELSYGQVRVFEAKDRRTVGEQVAYVCNLQAVPRISAISSYRHLKNPHILRMHDAGIVHWEPEGRQLFAIVFERPPARRFIQEPDGEPYRLSEDRIISTLIQPILGVLSDLRNIDLVHGAVNAGNLFFSGAEGAETAFLGECLSAAVSTRQHALFEPVERSMAQATGRGRGTYRDDLYAFGICVAMAARGVNLLRAPEVQAIEGKIENGSYGYVVGGDRMPPGITEFLRGVLNDDDAQRWDVDEALRWLEGRRMSPKQPRANWNAARPFVFRDRKYRNLRAIAYALSQNIADAAAVAEQDQFDLWIKRNFADKEMFARLDAAWEKESGGTKEQLVTGVCMALDPAAPVRYRGLSILPGGFGTALADAFANDEDIQVYGELLTQQLFNNWVNLRFDEIPDATGLLTTFEKCRNFLHQKIPGYGMERILYTLNRDCVCLSPLLKDHFVTGPGGILTALESISKREGRPDSVLDRHMIAFLSVREPKMIDPFLGYITSRDRGHQVIGIMRTLARIQLKFGIGPVPGVTAWLASLIDPVIDRFHDSELREEIRKLVGPVKNTGNLAGLLELVDDNRVVLEDTRRFGVARVEYASLFHEKVQIEHYLKRRKMFGYATGRQISMLVSATLSAICILGYLVFYFTKGFK